MDVDSVVDSMDNMAGNMAGNTADKMVERMDRMGKTDNGLFFFDAFHNCHNHNPHRFGHNIASFSPFRFRFRICEVRFDRLHIRLYLPPVNFGWSNWDLLIL